MSESITIFSTVQDKQYLSSNIDYLRNEWPLDISKTYMYEVSTESRTIYRVFYSEFESLASGRVQLDKLPESVKINSPPGLRTRWASDNT